MSIVTLLQYSFLPVNMLICSAVVSEVKLFKFYKDSDIYIATHGFMSMPRLRTLNCDC